MNIAVTEILSIPQTEEGRTFKNNYLIELEQHSEMFFDVKVKESTTAIIITAKSNYEVNK